MCYDQMPLKIKKSLSQVGNHLRHVLEVISIFVSVSLAKASNNLKSNLVGSRKLKGNKIELQIKY